MVRRDVVFADAFAQVMRDAFGQPPRVDEDQGRAMLLDQLDERVVDLVPHLVAWRPGQVGLGGTSTARSSLPLVADVDDRRIGPAAAGQEVGDRFDRLLRGRKADTGGRLSRQCFQPFEREREVRAALVVGDRVDFVDDHGLHIAQDARGSSRR